MTATNIAVTKCCHRFASNLAVYDLNLSQTKENNVSDLLECLATMKENKKEEASYEAHHRSDRSSLRLRLVPPIL